MLWANIEDEQEATIKRFSARLNREIVNIVELHHYVEYLEDMAHMVIQIENQLKRRDSGNCFQ